MFKLISILLISIHLIPLAHAELDKTLYTSEERWEKISNFDWKNSNDEPIIEDNDANAYIDLRNFPFVSYLLNTSEVQQFRFWMNGLENKNTKYILILYPSNDPENDDAPLILAMGKDIIAKRVIEQAELHSKTIVRSPILARALFFTGNIGQTISEQLYSAVASILAYVYQLERGVDASLQEPEVPSDFIFDENGRNI